MSQIGFENALGTPPPPCPVCGMEGGHAEGCSALAEAIDAQGGDQHTPPIKPNATVNGKEAVIDGRTGGVKQPEMIQVETSDEDVLRDLAKCMEVEAAKRTIANTAANDLKAAAKKTKAAAEHAAAHYARSRQLDMDLTTGGTEPEDE